MGGRPELVCEAGHAEVPRDVEAHSAWASRDAVLVESKPCIAQRDPLSHTKRAVPGPIPAHGK